MYVYNFEGDQVISRQFKGIWDSRHQRWSILDKFKNDVLEYIESISYKEEDSNLEDDADKEEMEVEEGMESVESSVASENEIESEEEKKHAIHRSKSFDSLVYSSDDDNDDN